MLSLSRGLATYKCVFSMIVVSVCVCVPSVEVASKSVELDQSVDACLLGRLYMRGSEKRRQGQRRPDKDSHPPHVVDLLADCHSVIWMTYRWAGTSVGGVAVTCIVLALVLSFI